MYERLHSRCAGGTKESSVLTGLISIPRGILRTGRSLYKSTLPSAAQTAGWGVPERVAERLGFFAIPAAMGLHWANKSDPAIPSPAYYGDYALTAMDDYYDARRAMRQSATF